MTARTPATACAAACRCADRRVVPAGGRRDARRVEYEHVDISGQLRDHPAHVASGLVGRRGRTHGQAGEQRQPGGPAISGESAHQCGEARIRRRVGPRDRLALEVAGGRPRRDDRLDTHRAELEESHAEPREAPRGDGVGIEARAQADGRGEVLTEVAGREPRVGPHVAQEVDHRRAEPRSAQRPDRHQAQVPRRLGREQEQERPQHRSV